MCGEMRHVGAPRTVIATWRSSGAISRLSTAPRAAAAAALARIAARAVAPATRGQRARRIFRRQIFCANRH